MGDCEIIVGCNVICVCHAIIEDQMVWKKPNTTHNIINIRLSLERFEGNPILEPDSRHCGRQKLHLIRLPSMMAVRCAFIGPFWDGPFRIGYAPLDGLHINESLINRILPRKLSKESVISSYGSERQHLCLGGDAAVWRSLYQNRRENIHTMLPMTDTVIQGRLSSIHINDFSTKMELGKNRYSLLRQYWDKNAAFYGEINGKLISTGFPNI